MDGVVVNVNGVGCAGSKQVEMSASESLGALRRLYARATPSTPACCFRPNHLNQALCRPASTNSQSSSGGDPRPSTLAKLT